MGKRKPNPGVSLTDRKLQSLKRNPKLEDKLGHYDTWDTTVRGLGVRTSAKGKTFVLMTRYPGARNPTRRALGAFPEMSLKDARTKAAKWKDLIGRGIDPAIAEEEERQAQLRLQANTFASVVEKYIAAKVIGPDPQSPQQRKAHQAARDFRGIFVPIWGARPITSITKGDVLSLIEAVRDNGTAATLAAYGKGEKAKRAPAPEQARDLLTRLKAFFTWAAGRDEFGLQGSPATFINGLDVIGPRRSVDRVLDDAELFALWRASWRLGYPYGPIYQLLALTGLRLNECCDAKWAEFDLAGGTWIIPANRMKGKNGTARPHTVPLTADILALLSELPRLNGGEHLFSTTGGAKAAWVSDRVKKRLDARMLRTLRAMARKRGDDPAKVTLPAWINHDLRRTLRSGLSQLRVNPDVAEAILAHKKPGIRGVYDKYEYFDEKKQALELWAIKLRSIVRPQPSNVVHLRSAQ
jgi:integrase